MAVNYEHDTKASVSEKLGGKSFRPETSISSSLAWLVGDHNRHL